MPHLNSSIIDAVSYDETTEIMVVVFKKGGRTVRYFNVPQSIYVGLTTAVRPSLFFNAYIRSHYQHD